ncbi:MAG: hypothetical protein ABIG89_00880 [Candidatus Woesearchaeota archaeon]
MTHNLIILLGESGFGEKTLVDLFVQKGYKSISLDDMMKAKLIGHDELGNAYKRLGEKAGQLLKNNHVVVGELCYEDDYSHAFSDEMTRLNDVDVFYFHLVKYKDDTIQKEKQDRTAQYDNIGAVEIQIGKLTPEDVVDNILNYILFHHKTSIDSVLERYHY